MAEKEVLGIKPTVKNVKSTKVEIYENIFSIVTDEENNSHIAIGNDIIWRGSFASVQEAKDFIDAKPWGLITNTVLYIFKKTENLLKQENIQ